jgi:hypothetical protein
MDPANNQRSEFTGSLKETCPMQNQIRDEKIFDYSQIPAGPEAIRIPVFHAEPAVRFVFTGFSWHARAFHAVVVWKRKDCRNSTAGFLFCSQRAELH